MLDRGSRYTQYSCMLPYWFRCGNAMVFTQIISISRGLWLGRARGWGQIFTREIFVLFLPPPSHYDEPSPNSRIPTRTSLALLFPGLYKQEYWKAFKRIKIYIFDLEEQRGGENECNNSKNRSWKKKKWNTFGR